MAVLAATSCSGPSDSATQTSPAPSSAEPSESATTTTTGASANGEDCAKAPAVAEVDPAGFEVLDEESLRGTPAEVQLPPDAGFPKAVVAVHDGAILLEESAEIDRSQTSGNGASYSRADLALRRIDATGATVWTLRLGTFVELYRTHQDASLVIDGDLVRVLWPRYDGALPAELNTPVPATMSLSAVRADGTLESEVELGDLPAPGAPAAGAVVVTALGTDGTAAIGTITGNDLQVDAFTPTGEPKWQDNLSAPPLRSIPQIAVLADSQVVAASGGQLARWDQDGRRQWDLALNPTSLAPIWSDSSNAAASEDVLLGFGRDEGAWFCALDANGRITTRTAEARRFWGEAERAWWTKSGLMVLSSYVALGANTNLITFDANGTLLRDVQVAGSGDVFPAPGSAVHDAATTGAGDLLLAAAITGYAPGADTGYENLQSWKALIRLPDPAGNGDLSNLPISEP